MKIRPLNWGWKSFDNMTKIISKHSNPLMVQNIVVKPEIITEVSVEAAKHLKRLYPSLITFIEIVEPEAKVSEISQSEVALDRESLKAKAKELGIEFAKNIKTEALAELLKNK